MREGQGSHIPRYDFECDLCGWITESDQPSADIDHTVLLCPECGGSARLTWLPNHRKPFPSFVTTHITGKPLEISSLQQIRHLEKARESTKFCWEPGSFDTKHGDL